MENPSPSNGNPNPAPGRRVRLIPATPRPALPQTPLSISSSSDSTPSTAFSGYPQAGSPRGVIPETAPDPQLTYPWCFLINGNRTLASLRPPNARQQTSPAVEPVSRTTAAPQPGSTPGAGPSRPPSTFGGRLYADIIKEAMERIPLFAGDGEGDGSPTSSSSLRFSTGDENNGESDGIPNGRKRGRTFDEIADEVIQEMQRADEVERQQQRGTFEVGGPSRRPDDEMEEKEDEWRKNLEAMVDVLTEEVAAQRGQLAKLTRLMERVVSWMEKENQLSDNPAPTTSVAPVMDSPPRNDDNDDNDGPSRRRRDDTTTNQPARSNKRTRHSGSPGGQGNN